MTEILERTEEDEDWENEGLDESNSAVRELRNKALPTAAFGVKFLAKIFGDITLSKSFPYNSSFLRKES